MTWDEITQVWSLIAVTFAILAGLGLGVLVIGRYASDPAYASGESSALEYGAITGVLAVAIGLVFYGFQIIGAIIDNDASWTRVVSRACLYVLYAACIGVGTGVRLSWHTRRKHREAHDRATEALLKK